MSGLHPAAHEPSRRNLLRYGFKPIGEIVLGPGGYPEFEFDYRAIPDDPGVYALADGEEVVLIGSSGRLRRRLMSGYRQTLGTRSSYAVTELTEAVKAGRLVGLLICRPDPVIWHGLSISIEHDIEQALIKTLQPRWNVLSGPGTSRFHDGAIKARGGQTAKQRSESAKRAWETMRRARELASRAAKDD